MSFVNPAQEPRMRARAERSMINHGPRARGVGSGVRRVYDVFPGTGNDIGTGRAPSSPNFL